MVRTFFQGVLNLLAPLPEPPPKTNTKPYFKTKMVLAKNIESGENVWLEMPVNQVDLRTRRTNASEIDGFSFRTHEYDR